MPRVSTLGGSLPRRRLRDAFWLSCRCGCLLDGVLPHRAHQRRRELGRHPGGPRSLRPEAMEVFYAEATRDWERRGLLGLLKSPEARARRTQALPAPVERELLEADASGRLLFGVTTVSRRGPAWKGLRSPSSAAWRPGHRGRQLPASWRCEGGVFTVVALEWASDSLKNDCRGWRWSPHASIRMLCGRPAPHFGTTNE